MGAVSLWTRLPTLYLCTGRQKSTPHPSCQDRQLELVAAATQRRPTTSMKCATSSSTASVVAHNGQVNDLVQRIQRDANVGARLSPPRVHSRTAGPTQKNVDHLINLLQLEKRDGNRTKGICICATTGMSTTGSKHENDKLHCGSRLSPTTAHDQLDLHKNIDHLVNVLQ